MDYSMTSPITLSMQACFSNKLLNGINRRPDSASASLNLLQTGCAPLQPWRTLPSPSNLWNSYGSHLVDIRNLFLRPSIISSFNLTSQSTVFKISRPLSSRTIVPPRPSTVLQYPHKRPMPHDLSPRPLPQRPVPDVAQEPALPSCFPTYLPRRGRPHKCLAYNLHHGAVTTSMNWYSKHHHQELFLCRSHHSTVFVQSHNSRQKHRGPLSSKLT